MIETEILKNFDLRLAELLVQIRNENDKYAKKLLTKKYREFLKNKQIFICNLEKGLYKNK